MRVKSSVPIDLKQSISVLCENAVYLDEIPDQIEIIEGYLKEHGFTVIRNNFNYRNEDPTIIDSSEYFISRQDEIRRQTELKESKKERTKINYAKLEANVKSYYILNYSINQIKDVGIDYYLLKVNIYERSTKKILAYGEVENYHGKIRAKFEKYLRDFFDHLSDLQEWK